MSSSYSHTSPAWLLQPIALCNVFSNLFASLKDVPSFVNVPDFPLFSSGLKQALYWRRRLASSSSPNTVIFSFLGEKGLILPNVLEVSRALKSICDMSKVIEFYRAFNSSFIGISFSDSSEAVKFRSLFKFYHNNLVIHVIPSSSHVHPFKLMWLPPLFPDSRIHHFLNKHSIHHHFSRDLISTDDNVSTPTNSVSGTMELSPSQDVNTIPHLIPLPSPHLGSALLIISGRTPLCLKCGVTGHLRRVCPSPKCISCHLFHPHLSPCVTSKDLSSSSSITPWMDPDPDDPITTPVTVFSHHSALECDDTFIASAPDPLSSDASPTIAQHANIVSSDTTLNNAPSSPVLPLSHSVPISSDYVMPVANTSSASTIHHSSSFISHETSLQNQLEATFAPEASYSNAASASALPTSYSKVVSSGASVLSTPPLINISSTAATTQDSGSVDQSSLSMLQKVTDTSAVISKSVASFKRTHTGSTSSSSLSQVHDHSSNIFSFLIDEVTADPIIPTTDFSLHQDLSTDVNIVQSDPSTSTTFVTHISDIPQVPSVSSHSSSHKRVKRTSADHLVSSIVSSPSCSLSLVPSWGERMEEETAVPVLTASHLSSVSSSNQSFKDSLPSATAAPILPTSSSLMITASHAVEPSSHVNTDSETDTSLASHDSASGYRATVLISGFPEDTLRRTLRHFVGHPRPVAIQRQINHDKSFTGYFIATYNTEDEAQHVLTKDGTWHDSRIISVSLRQSEAAPD